MTGPTGSGKTTTLYTGLTQLNSVTRKIVTVEDPIEYQLAGINQIQVKPQIGLSFATLLRSILRQDPDVIMVGEIRDLETAQIAVQAALTGHLVLSTLHTNSAAATITRLRDMGLEDYLLTAVLRGVLAQRLVRRLCPDCKQAADGAAGTDRAVPARRRTERADPVLWHAVGCPQCRGTGYRGRQAIAEFLVPDAEMERLVFARADHGAIERAAVAAGMLADVRCRYRNGSGRRNDRRRGRSRHPFRRGMSDMSSFRYEAVDQEGTVLRGVIKASDEAASSTSCRDRAISRCASTRRKGWRLAGFLRPTWDAAAG